ncbi:hypothetical protein BUE67_13455, partial [Corynebacterium diphtheriae]
AKNVMVNAIGLAHQFHSLLPANEVPERTEGYEGTHPEIKHGRHTYSILHLMKKLGRGPHKFNVERFNADFAYTMDGSEFGELQFEVLMQQKQQITTHGVNVHPGSAKNVMVNAIGLAHQFHSLLPANEVPERTEGYEG